LTEYWKTAKKFEEKKQLILQQTYPKKGLNRPAIGNKVMIFDLDGKEREPNY